MQRRILLSLISIVLAVHPAHAQVGWGVGVAAGGFFGGYITRAVQPKVQQTMKKWRKKRARARKQRQYRKANRKGRRQQQQQQHRGAGGRKPTPKPNVKLTDEEVAAFTRNTRQELEEKSGWFVSGASENDEEPTEAQLEEEVIDLD